MSHPEQAILAHARARLGTSLKAKYRLESLLGVGGMAAVYSATHRNAKRVAVKILHTPLSLHADMRARFIREGYVANSVGHPGAVAVLDDDVADDGAAFLVMELLEGETLDEVQKRLGPALPLRTVVAVARDLLDVLASAHARSIVHRDIKPANLFLTCDGQVKVLDFGVARMRDASGSNPTHSGLTLGTPAFMAPEQAIGRAEVDGRADVWAVGATIFTLLSGKQVHGGGSSQETLILAATRTAPSVATVRPDLPAALVQLLDKALAFAPEARWETAAAMRDAIEAFVAESEGGPISSSALRAVAVARPPPVLTIDAPTPSGDVHDLPTLSTPNARSLVGVAAQPQLQPPPRTRHVVTGITAAVAALAIAITLASRMRMTPPPSPVREAGSPAPPTLLSSAPVLESAPAPMTPPAVSASPPSASVASPNPLTPPRHHAPYPSRLAPSAAPSAGAPRPSAPPPEPFDR
ncbi:MAG TPA: protein kinase, partial [Polyangiaceae bacterium]